MFKKKKEKKPSFYLRDEMIFNVAGVTFGDRQARIKNIAKEVRSWCDRSDLYGGYTNKEIYEMVLNVSELEGVDVGLIEINEAVYEDQRAYVVQYKDEILGYVPKDRVEELHQLLEKHKNVEMRSFIVGGKCKSVNYDEDKVVIEELTYGIEISLKFSTPVYV